MAINGGVVNTTGAQSFGEAATLGAATALTSTGGGAIGFGNTLNGAYTLAVNTSGATTFTGAVGGSSALTSLTTDAGGTVAINGGVVNTTGAQSYGEAVTLGANTILTSSAAGNITFGGTLNGAYTLAVNTAGITALNGEVGGTAPLTSLTTDAPGSVSMGGGLIKTTGAQTYNDAIQLASATTLQGVNLALMSTVDGTESLTLKDTGDTVLGGVIGGTTALMSLTTDSATTASGETHLKGASIHVTTHAVFNDIVKIFTDVTVQAAGEMTFAQTVNGDTAGTRRLTLDGGSTAAIVVGGAVGDVKPLSALEVVNSEFTTFSGPVTTSASVVLTDTAGSISFDGDLRTPSLTVAAESFALNLRGDVVVTNAVTLANTGAVQLGAVASHNLHFAGGLTASAPSALQLAGTVRTTNQAMVLGRSDASITLLGDTTINSGTGTLRLASPVSAGEAEYQLNLLTTGLTTIDGDLSSSGAFSFAGPVSFTSNNTLVTASSVTFGGAVTASGSLTIRGDTVIDGGSVNSGNHAQTYDGAVSISGLDSATTTFTGAGITFGATLDATSRVLVNDSGATTYTGAIGASAAPAHFETDAAGSSTFSGGLVRTSSPNSIYIADDVVVTANTTFDTTNNGALAAGANITFSKTLNGAANNTQAVTLNAGTNGVVLVSGAVGNTTPLSTLTLTHSNGATFAALVTTGTSVVLSNTTAGQTIRFADNLSTPVLNTTANGYNVELLGSATSVTDTNTATSFLNTGNLVLGNGVGDTLTFAGGLTATAPAAINAAGTVNTTNTAMSLGDVDTALTLTNHLTLNTTGGNASAGGDLTIGGAVNGTTANTESLTLNAGSTGAVSVVGAIGQSTSLKTLTLTHSNGATFAALVTTGTSVVLSNTTAGQTIRFADNLSTPVLNTTANGYNVELLGSATSVTDTNTATSFLNTGNLVLGNGVGDTLTFAGGLTATAPAAINAAGTVNTTNTAMSLGDVDTALTLTNHLTLNTTGGNASAGGDLTIGGAVNGTTANTESLTLNAGSTGAVSVVGAIGQSTSLKTLTLTHSNGATFAALVTTGTSVVLSNTTAGQTIRFADNLSTPVLTTTANGYHVELLGTITTVSAANTATTFLNTGNLVLGNSAGDTLTFAGGLTATAPAAISAAGTVNSTNTAITLGAAPVTLTGHTTLNAGSANLTLGGTVDGGYSLTLNSTGVTTISDKLGDSTALTTITTNAGGTLVMNGRVVTTTSAQSYGEDMTLGANTTLTASGVTFDGAVSGTHSLVVNGSTTLSGGSVTTTGAQTYNGAMTLGANTTLNANAADVTLNSTLDGTYDLTVNTTGTTALNGAVGSTAALTSLTTNAGGVVLVNTSSVHTSGTQTYHDIVSLLGSATLTGSTVTFNDAVIGTADLSVVGAVVLNAGSVNTSGTQSYSAGTSLMRDTVLTADSVSFVGPVDSASGSAYALSVISSGATTFGGAVGGTHALRSVTTDAGGTVAINGGVVTTTGAQTYGEVLSLGAATTLNASAVTFDAAVSGPHSLTVNGATTLNGGSVNTGSAAQRYTSTVGLGAATTLTASSVTLDGAVSGPYSLSVNGATTFNGGSVNTGSAAQSYSGTVDLGADTTLTASGVTLGGAVSGAHALTVNGAATINGGSVNTGTGAQIFTHTVALGADTTLTASSVTLDGEVSGAYAFHVNGAAALNGGSVNTGTAAQHYSSTVSLGADTTLTASDVTFDGAVSGNHRFVVNGSTNLNGGSVTTTDAQTYNGAMTLGANTTLNAGTADVLLHSTVDGAYALTVNTTGNTRFDGAVGGTTPLSSLATNGGGMVLVNTSTVHTSGTQTYNDMVTLLVSSSLTGSTVTFNDALVGAGDMAVVGAAVLNAGTINTSGTQSYSSTATLVRDTVLTASSVNLSGAVSGAHAFTVNGAATLNGGSVNTGAAAQRYNGTVSLGANTTLTASGVIFDNAVTGSGSLNVTGPVTINGGSVTTAGTQTYDSAMTLGADTSLTASVGTVSFVSITDGAASHNLDISTAEALVLNDVTLDGNLHVTTQAGGVAQATGTRLDIGGSSRFTATVTADQDAALTSTLNRFVGTLTLDEVTPGSWRDVSLTTTTALTLGPLLSGGSVSVLTQGAPLIAAAITTSGDLDITTAGGTAQLGETTVSGGMTLNTKTGVVDAQGQDVGGGAVSQTGQLVVTGTTTVSAGQGSITLLNPLNSFGDTLALQGTSTSVATSGNLDLASVTNTGPMLLRAPNGWIDLGSAFITGGDLTLESMGDMNLGGADITGNLNMTSTQGAVAFGQATVTGSLTATTNGQEVDLGSAFVGGDLNVQTNGGNVVQSATQNAALQVAGSSNINAGSGDVTLPNVPNQFGGVVSLQANNVELVASSNLVLGPSTLTGNVEVTSVTGSITQTAPMAVAGQSSFTAHTDVVLEQSNTFTQAVALDAVNVKLKAATALTLDTSTVTGDLALSTLVGDITQTGPLNVVGKSEFITTAGNVTLTDPDNLLGDVVVAQTSGTLSLTTKGPLTMDDVMVQGNADLMSSGVLNLGKGTYGAKLKANSGGADILQSGPIKFVGDTDFDAGNGKIDLFDPNNLWTGVLTFKGGLIMINHPVLMNAVSAGTLVVRVETTIPNPVKPVANVSAASSGQKTDISVSTVRQASSDATGLIRVGLSAEAAAPGKSFAIDMSDHIPTAGAPNAEVKVTQMDGRPLPEWLKFDASTKTFVASNVPPGAFPLQLRVGVGAADAVILIQQQPDAK